MATEPQVKEQLIIKTDSCIQYIDIDQRLQYVYDIEQLIWSLNNDNLYQSREQIMKIIKEHKNIVKFTLKCIDYVSNKRKKEYQIFVDIFIYISRAFNTIVDIKNNEFAVLLNYYGLKLAKDKKTKDVDTIKNIAPENTIYHAIIWDQFEKMGDYYVDGFDPNKTYKDYNSNKFSLLDLAAKYSSVNCFKFLIANNAKITEKTVKACIEGGNNEILRILVQKGANLNFMLSVAIESHQNQIADYLISNFNCEKITIAQCLAMFNIQAAFFLFDNGNDINETFNEILYLYSSKNSLYSIIQFTIHL